MLYVGNVALCSYRMPIICNKKRAILIHFGISRNRKYESDPNRRSARYQANPRQCKNHLHIAILRLWTKFCMSFFRFTPQICLTIRTNACNCTRHQRNNALLFVCMYKHHICLHIYSYISQRIIWLLPTAFACSSRHKIIVPMRAESLLCARMDELPLMRYYCGSYRSQLVE